MFILQLTPEFHRTFNKIGKRDKKLRAAIELAMEKLRRDPKLPGLRSHITGYDYLYGNLWSSWVTGDIRIIWTYHKTAKLFLILVKVGGHDEVYRN